MQIKVEVTPIQKLTSSPEEIATKRCYLDLPGFSRIPRLQADTVCGRLNEIFSPKYIPTAEGNAWRAIHDDGRLGIECAATIPEVEAVAFLFRHLALLAAA